MLEHLIMHVLVQFDREVEGESSARLAVCRHCKKRERLLTTKVRKRLKLLYLPVAKLGRRVLVDHCQGCKKSALELDVATWQRFDAAARALAAEPLRRHPRAPEAWLEQHAAALVFARESEAEDLAYRLAIDPRSSARVHAELAWAQRWRGHDHAAREAEERARSLDPHATSALDVEAAIARGDVDTALTVLRMRRASLGDIHQGSVRALVRGLADAKRWRDLHALLQELFATFPHFAFDREARRAARLANRRIEGASPLRLPRLPGENKVRNLAVAGAAAVVALFVALEWAARANRPVFLVNAGKVVTRFSIDGGAKEHIAGRGWQRHDLAYGTHEIAVEGAASRTFELDVPHGSSLALFDRRVVVVDLGGDAVLRHENLPWGAPRAQQIELCFGRDVYAFDDLSSAFGRRIARWMDAERGGGEKVGLGESLTLVTEPIALTALTELRERRLLAAAELLENHMRLHPDAEDGVFAYAWIAQRLKWFERARAVLAPRIEREPLSIEAHWAAWRLFRGQDEADALAKRYEERIASSSPSAATLSTLRAHLATRRDEAIAWVDRGIAIDGKDMLSRRHAADLTAGVDWNASLAHARAGLEVDEHDAFLLDVRNGAMLALGRAAELEATLRAEIERHRGNQERLGRLAEVLVARGRATEVDVFVGEQERSRNGASARQARRLRALAMEAGGRLEELAKSPLDLDDAELTRWQILALAELGRGEEVERRMQRETRIVDRWADAVVIGLALDLAGDAMRASKWRSLAVEIAQPWGPDAVAAAILRGDRRARAPEIEALALGAHDTAVLMIAAAHAWRDGEDAAAARAELLDAAERFHPWPGHVQRLVARLRAAS